MLQTVLVRWFTLIKIGGFTELTVFSKEHITDVLGYFYNSFTMNFRSNFVIKNFLKIWEHISSTHILKWYNGLSGLSALTCYN